MNFCKVILSAMFALLATTACSQNKTEKQMENKKVLVVYFSATGTTKHAAEQLAKVTHADLCEIIPEQAYTSEDLDWNNRQSRSSVEMNNPHSRPTIKPDNVDVSQYDYIFLGYPIWWDLAPRAVNTFVESHDFSGKKVITFATSGGSTISNSTTQLKKSYPKTEWIKGKLLNGANEASISDWVSNLIK